MPARSIAILAFLVACHSSSTTTSPGSGATQGSGQGSAASGSAAEPAGSGVTSAMLGTKCGDNDSCPAGTTCVSYYGIAGARGPQFKTCEVKCEDDAKCPSGTKCATIADGPGRVCR